MVTLVPEDQLMAQAAAADEALAHGKWLGPLHGLPVAVKDLHETPGIRTTYGSPLQRTMCRISIAAWYREKKRRERLCWERRTYRNSVSVPRRSIQSSAPRTILTTQARPAAGALAAGRSRWPVEWLPWPMAVTWEARCAILPTSAMWWASAPRRGECRTCLPSLGWFTFSVPGPVARNVTDCAYFLSVLAGYDHHSPISIEQSGSTVCPASGARNFKGVRVAMFKDMGLPWEPEVKAAVQAQRKVFESLGCIVEDAEPDFPMRMRPFWRGATGRSSWALGICWPRMVTSLTNTFTGTLKKDAS